MKNIINREIYVTNGEYTIFLIAEEDRDFYVELHKQINGETSLFLNPMVKDMMWDQTLHGEDKIFSIFDAKGNYCGSIELQNPTGITPEIGIDLLETMRNKGITGKVVMMFARRTYELQSLNYFLIRISSKNLHSKHVFEKMGVVKIGEEESAFNKFVEKYSDVVGAADNGAETFKQFFYGSEDEIIYRYKLMPEVFMQQGER